MRRTEGLAQGTGWRIKRRGLKLLDCAIKFLRLVQFRYIMTRYDARVGEGGGLTG